MTSSFGPYQLIRKIAQGGMAEVFLASRQGEIGGFSKQVAIKRIYEHLAEDPELITMFFDEGRIAARLNHPNIVQIYDLGQIDGCFYIAMEFVNGCDLRSLAERGLQVNNFLPLPMAVKVIAEAAAGLHYAHTRHGEDGRALNIVHRDVSPQNILISMDGSIKVCDFGIAKAEARMTQTQTGQFKGKFSYMSPEQVLGSSAVLDRRSDIFSLGIVLYEITVCTRLFRGKNDYDTIRMVTEAEVAPPTQVRKGFPADLERIILKALSREPERRYQSAEQMQMELEEWLLEHRAKTSPVHVSRYMQQVFPELIERAGGISHDATVERNVNELASGAQQYMAQIEAQRQSPPTALATAKSSPRARQQQPNKVVDRDATYDDLPGAQARARASMHGATPIEYADADATGELDVSRFQQALEHDQSSQERPLTPELAAIPERVQQISAQWSSAEPDFSEVGMETRITSIDSIEEEHATTEVPLGIHQDLMRQSGARPMEPAPPGSGSWPHTPSHAAQGVGGEPSSGQWSGPQQYAQSSGHWSSAPADIPVSSVSSPPPSNAWNASHAPQPVNQWAAQPAQQPQQPQQPVAASWQQHPQQPSGQWQPPQQPQYGNQWGAEQQAQVAANAAQSAQQQWQYQQPQQPSGQWQQHQQPQQPQQQQQPQQPQRAANPHLQETPSDLPESSWDAGMTGVSMQHDIKALQRGNTRKKLLYLIIGAVALAGVAIVLVVVGVNRPPTKIEDPNTVSDPALLDVPPPQPLVRVDVPLATSPQGARVVINGLLAEGTTPGDFQLVDGQKNEVLFFLEGRQPRRVVIDAEDSPEPFALEEATRVEPERISSMIVESEPLGALVYHNGVQIGPSPVTLNNLDPDQEHHVLVTAKDYHAYSALLQPVVGSQDKVRAVLDPTTLKSREFYVDLSLETIPRGARVSLDGETLGTTPVLKKADRHKLHKIEYEAPNFKPQTRYLESREAGTVMLRPHLQSIQREKGTVSITLPSNTSQVYLGSNAYGDKDIKKLELTEGMHNVVLESDSGKRFESKVEVFPDAHTKYKAEIVNGQLRLRSLK